MENTAHTTTASDVAKYILTKEGSLTGYQIQKLLYYCQAWSFVVNGRTLFDEEIKAYERGPVIQSVSLQHQRRKTVYPSTIDGNIDNLSADDIALIDCVLKAYRGMSGEELVALTHNEDPWKKAFNGYTGSCSNAIALEEVQKYYSHLLTSDRKTKEEHHVPLFDHPKNVYFTNDDFAWLETYIAEEA